jgi:hypothetical protein
VCSRAAVILAEAGGHWRPEQELGNSIADSSAREVSKLLARMRLIQPGLRDMFLGAKLPLSFEEVQSS